MGKNGRIAVSLSATFRGVILRGGREDVGAPVQAGFPAAHGRIADAAEGAEAVLHPLLQGGHDSGRHLVGGVGIGGILRRRVVPVVARAVVSFPAPGFLVKIVLQPFAVVLPVAVVRLVAIVGLLVPVALRVDWSSWVHFLGSSSLSPLLSG